MGEMHEPEIVIIKESPVVLGEPEFPFNARLPPPWSRKLVHVPTFGIGKYAAKLSGLDRGRGTGCTPIGCALYDAMYFNVQKPGQHGKLPRQGFVGEASVGDRTNTRPQMWCFSGAGSLRRDTGDPSLTGTRTTASQSTIGTATV